MGKSGSAMEKWKAFCGKAELFFEKAGHVLGAIWASAFKLRKVIMAVPVIIGAVWLALNNYKELPEYVGINLQASGEYAQMISRDLAVLGPLAVTAACLLLMFCSRRALYPWVISVFSLILPLFILVSNVFPA